MPEASGWTGDPRTLHMTTAPGCDPLSRESAGRSEKNHPALKIVLYNPMCGWGDRLTEIATEAAADILALPGTQWRMSGDQCCTTFRLQGTRHQAWQWGWRLTKTTNRSCGVSLVLGPRLRKHVVAVFSPPRALQGRAGALRIRTATTDILAVVLYVPCKVAGDKQDLQRREAVQEILKWVNQLLRKTPARTIPVILGDMNTRFGLQSGHRVQADSVVGDTMPRAEESHVSSAIRELCREQGLRVETTFHRAVRYSFFAGSSSASTLIDHILLPASAGALVDHMYTDRRMMRRLQHVNTARPVDHCPVVLRLRAQLCHIQSPMAKINLDDVMDAVKNKSKRANFVNELEKAMENTSNEKWQEMIDEPRPDKAWTHMREKMAEVTLHCFPAAAPPETSEPVQRRLELLSRRRAVKGSIVDDNSHEEAQLELTLLTRRLRKLRDRQRDERETELIEQIWSAWKAREFARMHRLRALLSRRGLGPKKRNYLAPRQLAPTAQQWQEAVEKPGVEGGLGGETTTLEAHQEKVAKDIEERDFEPYCHDSALEELVDKDWKNMLWALNGSRRRRSCPPWGALAETMILAMTPNRKHKLARPEVVGIGMSKKLETPVFTGRLRDLLAHIRRHQLLPMDWLRSWSVGLGKPGKPAANAGELRLIHIFCQCGAAWMKALSRDRAVPWFPSWCYGGLAGRAREGAMQAAWAAAWRMKDIDRSAVWILFDARNAFACSKQQRLAKRARDWLGEEACYYEDLQRWALSSVAAVDEQYHFRPTSGGLMGHPYAPLLFNLDYSDEIRDWNQELHHHGFLARDPVTGKMADLGMQLFVDDVGRMFGQELGQSHSQLVEHSRKCAAGLEEKLAAAGYALNKKKGRTLLGLRGRGAAAITRACTAGRQEVYGEAARCERYLGAQMMATPEVNNEIAKRCVQTKIAWRQCGSFWASSCPYKLVRLMIICLLQGTMLAGMTAFPLAARELERMDRQLAIYLRRLWHFRHKGAREEGRHISAKKAFAFWGLAPCGTELRVRRLKRYGAYMKNPLNHVSELAAHFGTTRFDKQAGRERMAPNGCLGPHPTPLAVQMLADFEAIAKTSERAEMWWEDAEGRVVECFTQQSLIDDFCLMDPAVLRSEGWQVEWAEVAGSESGSSEASCQPAFGEIMCTEIGSDNLPCLACFSTRRGFLSHVRKLHGARNRLAQMVVTNQCPYCLSTFLNRACAVDHLKRVLGEGGSNCCAADVSKWSSPVVEPRNLTCPICSIWFSEAAGLPSLQRHICSHHSAPEFIKFTLPDLPLLDDTTTTSRRSQLGRRQGQEPARRGRGSRGRGGGRGRRNTGDAHDDHELAEARNPDIADSATSARLPLSYDFGPARDRVPRGRGRGRPALPRAGEEGGKGAQARGAASAHRGRGHRSGGQEHRQGRAQEIPADSAGGLGHHIPASSDRPAAGRRPAAHHRVQGAGDLRQEWQEEGEEGQSKGRGRRRGGRGSGSDGHERARPFRPLAAAGGDPTSDEGAGRRFGGHPSGGLPEDGARGLDQAGGRGDWPWRPASRTIRAQSADRHEEAEQQQAAAQEVDSLMREAAAAEAAARNDFDDPDASPANEDMDDD